MERVVLSDRKGPPESTERCPQGPCGPIAEPKFAHSVVHASSRSAFPDDRRAANESALLRGKVPNDRVRTAEDLTVFEETEETVETAEATAAGAFSRPERPCTRLLPPRPFRAAPVRLGVRPWLCSQATARAR